MHEARNNARRAEPSLERRDMVGRIPVMTPCTWTCPNSSAHAAAQARRCRGPIGLAGLRPPWHLVAGEQRRVPADVGEADRRLRRVEVWIQ
ncbi:hypothetical protein ACU686_11450 [Yinghuangia aomiensis]